ncbi:AAA family ATPase, partial [Pseudomonas syringae]|nr:AAA family ATPase [Pseudomonas syringae]
MLAPKLHLLCGKIASGKSTLAKSIATKHSAILLSEDQWLSRLY